MASALMAALSPILVLRAVVAYISQRRVFDEHQRLGRGFEPITIRSFAGRAPGRRLAYLASVASGDVRFIGPRPLHPEDWEARARRSPDVMPGMLSTGRLRARLGIDYDPERQHGDQSLFRRRSLTLMVRYAIAEVLGDTHLDTPPTFSVLGLTITNTTMDEALDWCLERAAQRPASFLAFVNAACLNEKTESAAYARALTAADRILPDGIGVKIGARLQHVSVVANVNGTDLFPRMCERAAKDGLRLFLLGARPGVAKTVAENMRREHPGLMIAGVRHGYFEPHEEAEVVEEINVSKADILLVAFGVPAQEKWIDAHIDRLDIGLALGVGGLFDFYSGRIPRAPHWVREIGLEWAWRLVQEPGRMWRRYIVGNPLFLWRAWRDARRQASRARGLKRAPVRPLLDYRDEYADDYVGPDPVPAPGERTAPPPSGSSAASG